MLAPILLAPPPLQSLVQIVFISWSSTGPVQQLVIIFEFRMYNYTLYLRAHRSVLGLPLYIRCYNQI